jgi:hypothetical protein
LNRRSALRALEVAAEEMRRAMRSMRIPGYPRPFYLGCLIRDQERWRLQARYGSLVHDEHERSRNGFVDVRVGSWRSDQVRDGGLFDNDKEAESYGYVDLPFDGGEDGLRHGLWRLADARYREALESLLAKRSHEVGHLDPNRHLPAFERRRRASDLRFRRFPTIDREGWARYVERVSRRLRRRPDIHDSHVEFEADHLCRIFVDADGTRRLECQVTWSIECYLWMLAPDGSQFPWTIKHLVSDPREIPSEERLAREVDGAVKTLGRLAKAPTLRSFCGPALLEPVPAGLLLHEAVGHRLEGNRLLAAGEGQTFKDSLGDRVLPEFLSVVDDPRLERFGGRSLVGSYRFDDEGLSHDANRHRAPPPLERTRACRLPSTADQPHGGARLPGAGRTVGRGAEARVARGDPTPEGSVRRADRRCDER